MTRKRCPWCGKIIDKTKDKDPFPWQGGLSLLHCATCSHCRHNYGQFPVFPHLMKINLLVLLLVVLSFAFQSGILLAITFVALLASIPASFHALFQIKRQWQALRGKYGLVL